jgi:hypothetical protein
MIGASELQSKLQQFSGTERYHRYGSFNLTDGIKYLAEKAECFWLLDIIQSYKFKINQEPFVVIQLERNEDESFTFYAYKDWDSGLSHEEQTDELIVKQEIPFSDFPLQEFHFYVIGGVILLTTEY